jgi:hypothetical protein
LTDSFDTGLVTRKGQCYILPYSSFVGFALSSENPDWPTGDRPVGSGAGAWRNASDFDRDIISWIESLVFSMSTEITQRMLSVFMPDIINVDYLDLCGKRAANVSLLRSRVCTENVTDKLCEAVNSVSLFDVVANLDIPCNLLQRRRYRDFSFIFYGQQYQSAISTTFYGPLGVLPVTGDHFCRHLCSLAFWNGFSMWMPRTRPNLISALCG